MHDESLYAERVLRAGARGYITKQEATKKILLAIRQVMAGQIYISEKMAARMVHKMVVGRAQDQKSPIERLTDRELEARNCSSRPFNGFTACRTVDRVVCLPGFFELLTESCGDLRYSICAPGIGGKAPAGCWLCPCWRRRDGFAGRVGGTRKFHCCRPGGPPGLSIHRRRRRQSTGAGPCRLTSSVNSSWPFLLGGPNYPGALSGTPDYPSTARRFPRRAGRGKTGKTFPGSMPPPISAREPIRLRRRCRMTTGLPR